jgi:anti-sigma B factor antagonist
MEIKRKEEGNITLLELIGNLDTNTAPAAEKAVNEVIDLGVDKLLFDLSNTGFVSSAGLRVFLVATKKLSAKGGSVKLCAPNDVVKEILEISGFTTIIDVRSSVEQGIDELK